MEDGRAFRCPIILHVGKEIGSAYLQHIVEEVDFVEKALL
jgi:hypothetical protein